MTTSTTSSWSLSSPSFDLPSIKTMYADASKVVISLPDDWVMASPGQQISTYILDSLGHTTRTLGWPEGPTTTLQFAISTRSFEGSAIGFAQLRSRTTTSTTSSSSPDPSPEPLPSSVPPPVTTDSSTSTISNTSVLSSPQSSTTPVTMVPSSVVVSDSSMALVSPSTLQHSTSPSPSRKTTFIALGISGAVGTLLIIGIVLYLRWRYRRRKVGVVKTSISTTLRGDSRSGTEKRTESESVQTALSPVTIIGEGGLGEGDAARTSTLPSATRLKTPEQEAKRRVPSREQLAPLNLAPGPLAPDRSIRSPIPRPPYRTWEGFTVEEIRRMQQAPMSVTEDYSTNAGEGSVDGYWEETASMRDERIYRLHREGHTPPLPSTPTPPEESQLASGDFVMSTYARQPLARIAEGSTTETSIGRGQPVEENVNTAAPRSLTSDGHEAIQNRGPAPPPKDAHL